MDNELKKLLGLNDDIANELYNIKIIIKNNEYLNTKYEQTMLKLLKTTNEDEQVTALSYFEKMDNGYKIIAVLILELIPALIEKYKLNNIDYIILKDTLSDYSLWINKYYLKTGEYGLKEYKWLVKHFTYKIFKLGRLQFEPGKSKYFEGNVLHIHIPEGNKLDTKECLISFDLARKFFVDKNIKYFICTSWLLDKNLNKLLDENSNIIRFQKLFKLIDIEGINRQSIERIFDIGDGDYRSVTPKTNLQIKAKEYLIAGGTLSMGFGYIEF